MKVALIGIGGNVGQRLAAELTGRGHAVTGIGRHADSVAAAQGVTLRRADANDSADLATAIAGHDAVILSGNFVSVDPGAVLAALGKAGVARLLVVGGAGSLEVAPGVQLVDTPDFPEEYKPEVLAGRRFLEALRASDADWTFLSPPLLFVPGERTGQYRLGGDQLMFDAAGDSRISYEDFAKAIVDEMEDARHSRARFSIAY